MTGKRTFAQGAHPSNDPTGEWEQIPILARDLERLEAIVGRPFADIDRVRVMALVNVVHSVRVINIACNVPAQDIKATLRAIGGLDASKVADALANADWYSKRLIEESLLWILACDLQDMRQVRPAAIRAAALLAAQDFKQAAAAALASGTGSSLPKSALICGANSGEMISPHGRAMARRARSLNSQRRCSR